MTQIASFMCRGAKHRKQVAAMQVWFRATVEEGRIAHCTRSAELRFGKIRRESPVRADSEIGAPISEKKIYGITAR